jgi:hypothetical protein
MKTKNNITVAIVSIILLMFDYGCTIFLDDTDDCSTFPGYEVWAGDTYYGDSLFPNEYFYNIDKYDYTFIGESDTTETFYTGDFKYYVVVGKDYACIDAIQFNDTTFWGDGAISIILSGNCDWHEVKGPPDGNFGRLGWKPLCPDNSFLGYITDDGSIYDRGGKLTVFINTTYDCQNRTDPPGGALKELK